VIVSPDGTRLVFASQGPDGKRRLSTRLLNQWLAAPLPGTEGAREDAFFSPDGNWVGFFAEGKLKKISVQGGAPVTLGDAPNPRGGSWGDDDSIVLAPNIRGGLVRIFSNGGAPKPLTELGSGEVTHRWPQLLPGSKAVLFTAGSTRGDYENAAIQIQSIKTGHRKTLHEGGSYGRYVRSGHLLYVHQGTLFARPFDFARLEATGSPAPVLEDMLNSPVTGSAQFSFSDARAGPGALLYLAGKEAQTSILWLEGTGKMQPLHSVPGFYYTPRFSPDGSRLVVALFSGNPGLWILDCQQDTMVRITFTAGDNNPVWSPDGKHLAYDSAQTGIFWIRSDGAGSPQRLSSGEHLVFPYSFSPDGKRLAYAELNPETGFDLWMLRWKEPTPIILSLEGRSRFYARPRMKWIRHSHRMGAGWRTPRMNRAPSKSTCDRSPDRAAKSEYRLPAVEHRSGPERRAT
jgi:WD40 repeat protein